MQVHQFERNRKVIVEKFFRPTISKDIVFITVDMDKITDNDQMCRIFNTQTGATHEIDVYWLRYIVDCPEYLKQLCI